MPLFLPSVPLSGGTLTGPLVIGGGAVTANAPVLNLTQTWNEGSTTFEGIKLNVTDSASGGSSLLARFQVGGNDRVTFTKSGSGVFNAAVSVGSVLSLTQPTGTIVLYDTTLARGAANTLDLRNSTNAQTWNVYGTADAGLLNYRRIRTTMTTGGAATIAAEGFGAGATANTLTFVAVGGINFSNAVSIDNGVNITLATANGSKIGTGTTQKLGFWNATPIVQPSGTGETAGFTAGGGTNVTDSSTFTGNVGSTAYRISDIVKALKNSGLMAS